MLIRKCLFCFYKHTTAVTNSDLKPETTLLQNLNPENHN